MHSFSCTCKILNSSVKDDNVFPCPKFLNKVLQFNIIKKGTSRDSREPNLAIIHGGSTVLTPLTTDLPYHLPYLWRWRAVVQMGFAQNAIAAVVLILAVSCFTGMRDLLYEDESSVSIAVNTDYGIQDSWPRFIARFLGVLTCQKVSNLYYPARCAVFHGRWGAGIRLC